MHARIIGYLMLNLDKYRRWLGDSPVSCVALKVISEAHGNSSADPSEGVYELGKRYRENLLRACTCPLCLV